MLFQKRVVRTKFDIYVFIEDLKGVIKSRKSKEWRPSEKGQKGNGQQNTMQTTKDWAPRTLVQWWWTKVLRFDKRVSVISCVFPVYHV